MCGGDVIKDCRQRSSGKGALMRVCGVFQWIFGTAFSLESILQEGIREELFRPRLDRRVSLIGLCLIFSPTVKRSRGPSAWI